MDTPGKLPTGDELQRHARWIRRLASGLLRDEAAAEDLVQDTWVAALTHPTAETRLRPWLRQVVRNFARQRHRGSARRSAREQVARPPNELPGPEELFERLETEQRLTRELGRLEEPFRSTLMLRYYEDLEPAVIAERLGAPGGTVRWRLKRGLELLRERLDDSTGGDRRLWSAALLPLARLDGAVAATTAAAVGAVALPGLLFMNFLKIACAGAALLVLALGLSVAGVLPPELNPWTPAERSLEVQFRPIEELAEPQVPEIALEPVALESTRAEAPGVAKDEPAPVAAAETLARVDARVLGRGRSLAGARMVLVRGDQRMEPTLSDRDGSVTNAFALERGPDLVRIEFHALGFASRSVEAVCSAGSTTHLGQVELAPGGVVSGRVVDERGRGLPGCRITTGELTPDHRRMENLRLEPADSDVPGCTSDANGGFRLIGAPAGMVRLWAHHPGRLAAFTPPLEVREGQESFGVELTLEPLPPENLVRGLVLDPTGQPVPRAAIDYRCSSRKSGTTTSSQRTADSRGAFEFVLPADARLWLTASDPNGRWNPGSVSDIGTSALDVTIQLVEARQVVLSTHSRGGTITRFGLEIVAPDGGPRLGQVPSDEHENDRVGFSVPTEPFLVRVAAAAHEILELGPFDPGTVEDIDAWLNPVPGLHGTVLRDGAPVSGVRVVLQAAVGADELVEKNGYRVRIHPEVLDEARSDEEGRFLITARTSGSFVLRAEPAGGAPCEYGPFEVGAELGGPPVALNLGVGGAIEGRVRLAAGADPEGAIVVVTRGDGGARTQRVGRDGTFRFEHLIPGPWRVDLAGAEIIDSRTSVSTRRGGRIEPYELDSNCLVHEGRTTRFDVSEVEALRFEGRLTVAGESSVGWSARLGPTGQLDFDGGEWTALDPEGRFTLRAFEPGPHLLALRRSDEGREQFLFDEVTVKASGGAWEQDLRFGTLVIKGVEAWTGSGPPGVVHVWKAPTGLQVLTAPVGGTDGYARIEVPAGKGKLTAPENDDDPETWPVLREVEVVAGAECEVELRL